MKNKCSDYDKADFKVRVIILIILYLLLFIFYKNNYYLFVYYNNLLVFLSNLYCCFHIFLTDKIIDFIITNQICIHIITCKEEII